MDYRYISVTAKFGLLSVLAFSASSCHYFTSLTSGADLNSGNPNFVAEGHRYCADQMKTYREQLSYDTENHKIIEGARVVQDYPNFIKRSFEAEKIPIRNGVVLERHRLTNKVTSERLFFSCYAALDFKDDDEGFEVYKGLAMILKDE
ncbi:hypothetical protein [Acaryochloris sp. CCMEE 5410]|uniref:hypothetical protein n=1 Tax=Acaryochloris sp. CCMEE 5410 TaxID=310037 RepID=UPI00024848FD|nr:hypothetical protein [Acaryochloris sp. CCMEE 5410]